MIGNIGVMGAVRTNIRLSREDGGGEIHGPENHSGCVRVDTLGGQDAVDFEPVVSQIAERLGNEEAEGANVTASAGHVMEASNGVQVMAATGAAANGSALAVAAVGQDVAAGTNDEARIHKALHRVNHSG
jgi:hypothetical protein